MREKIKKKKKKKKTKQGHVCQASKMESLSDELITDILSRVPTLELGNLRCVYKRWRDIVKVKDPLFCTLHSSHSMSKPTENSLLLLKGLDDDLCFVDLAMARSRRRGDVTIKTIKMPYIDVPSFSQYDVIGSCNGLLCLGSKKRMDIIVMNPITRQHLRLDMDFSGDVWSWGFGFESVKKMYKVVVVVWDRHLGAWKLKLCDLDSEWSSEWRDIGWENTIDGFNLSYETPACFVDGRLHWTLHNNGSVSIVSFDLAEEEFGLVPPPDCLRNRRRFDLFVLRRCLSIIRSQHSAMPRLGIWAMKEYGVKESWVKEVDKVPHIPKSLPYYFQFDKTQNDKNQKRMWRLNLKGLGSIGDGKVLLNWKRRDSEAILFSSGPTCDRFQFLDFENGPFFRGSVIHSASLNWI